MKQRSSKRHPQISGHKANGRRITALLVVPILVICLGGLTIWSLPADSFAAPNDPTQESSVVLENDQGDEVVINVEDELSAEDRENEDTGLQGAGDLGDENAVPLAGFSAVGSDRSDQLQIHLAWMAVLLAAAIAYALYFSLYQSRIFRLRREVAQAEHRIIGREQSMVRSNLDSDGQRKDR